MDASVFDRSDRWLEIRVGTEALSPKQRITSSAYSLVSENSRLLGGKESSEYVIQAQGLRLQATATSPNIIAGYTGNAVIAGVVGATIGGGGASGNANLVTDDYGTIGGGGNNQAGDNAGTTTDASYATVGGGYANHANGPSATVGGGQNNTASGGGTVGGGLMNTASGSHATVPGGQFNTAQGYCSFAAGLRAGANHDGCFVWGDSCTYDWVSSTGNDQFIARASGGVWFYSNSNLTAGVRLNAGAGSWSSISDRALKDNVTPVDGKHVLSTLMAMPMAEWNYKAQDTSVRHMGPMAQDFYAAFGLGEDDKHISTVDADGVALAAIQGLHGIVKEKDAKISSLEARIEALETLVEKLVESQTRGEE